MKISRLRWNEFFPAVWGWPMPAGRLFLFRLRRREIAFACESIGEQGDLLFASIEEIITPSPLRIEPPCPYFGRCGGCDFQQLTYEAQLAAKAEIIRDCLHRIARLENVPDIVVTAFTK